MDIIQPGPSIIAKVITQKYVPINLRERERDPSTVKHLAVYIFVLQAHGDIFFFYRYLHLALLKVQHTAGP